MWTKRGKACLILIFSANTNCESMAYRSFRSEEYSARGVRKVTPSWLEAIPPISQQPLRDITVLWQPSRSYRHSLLFDPSMSALAIIETQKLPKVSARTITMGFVMGDMMTKQLRIQLTLQLEAKLRIQLPWQLKAQLKIQLTLQLDAQLRTQKAACGFGGCGIRTL